MEYYFDESTFRELLAMMHHDKYEQDEIHRMRVDLSWTGDFSGQSRAVLIVMGGLDNKETILKNTLGFITGHIQSLYEEMLGAMLSLFSSMGADITKSNVVKTLSDMNAIREKEDFLPRIHINLDDIKEDIAVFSIFLQLRNSMNFNAPEGCEFVFDHNTLLFWGDENPGEHIWDYNAEFWGEVNGVKCEFSL